MKYFERLARARELSAASGIDVLLLSTGSDLPYLTGYRAPDLERLTMLVFTPKEAVLVLPELEAPRVEVPDEAFDLRPWGETEDPVSIVARIAGSPRRAAIGDQTWSTFVLGLQRELPTTEFSDASLVTHPLRMVKDPAELELLRKAGEAADRVIAELTETVFSGKTELELARLVAGLAVREGHDRAGEPIVASGPEGASPHHEPSGRIIEEGDLVVVDFGGTVGGYHSDTTRTFSVGQPPPEAAEIHAIVLAAQQAATAAVRPGIAAQQVDRAARQVIVESGYGEYFIHRTGHGIGLDVHEHPYLVEGNDLVLEPGMAFSVEPGIYLPHRLGVRIEDIVAVTSAGAELFNQSDRQLAVVG